MTLREVRARGWEEVDVVLVTGDAYVDHPSFAAALLGRVLEAAGYRVAVVSQPDWRTCEPWRAFGRPKLCFAVSAGNMDSMVNRYTANRKVRSEDAYSPDGRPGLRPDRATLAYCQRAKEAFNGVPIVAGGIEASLRRLAHYDYWSDKVRRSILLDAKPDLLVHGMGERPLLEIVARLKEGIPIAEIRDVRGTAYRLGAGENPFLDSPPGNQDDAVVLPGYEVVQEDKPAFAAMTRMIYRETNPASARRLVQCHAREAVVVNPPGLPLTQSEMDAVYGLPFTRRAHPSYKGAKIPALDTVRNSVTILRGCFGGCAFCSLTAHQGRVIQSRSEASVTAEVRELAARDDFSGTITDLGGPTANMYEMGCADPEKGAACTRDSCLYPNPCKRLAADHGPVLRLMQKVREIPGVRRAFIASGVRMDLALLDPRYIDILAEYHTGGHLSVAPEHASPAVLACMRKPDVRVFEEFAARFDKASAKAGKRQYLVPYFIAGHPGCDLGAMIDLACYLNRTGLRVEQVQDFLPGPFDLATCMYHTGLDPMNGKPVYVPKGARERRLQRALLQWFKPENYQDVRAALEEAGRTDLIGNRPGCLIPQQPPRSKSPGARMRPGGTRRGKGRR